MTDINQALADRTVDLQNVGNQIAQLQQGLANALQTQAHIQGAIQQLKDLGAVQAGTTSPVEPSPPTQEAQAPTPAPQPEPPEA